MERKLDEFRIGSSYPSAMLMKALVKTAAGVDCLEKPVPTLERGDEVLVRVMRAAICRTDVYAAKGRIEVAEGRVLGHEFAGVIEATGEQAGRLRVGDRVVVNPLLGCGHCTDCVAQRVHACAAAGFLGLDRDGAFAQWIVVGAAQVFPLPDTISFAVGAYAEPLAATMAVLDAGLPRQGRIAVTGMGRIAELTRMILEDHGHDDVIACESPAGESCCDAVVETNLCSTNAEASLRMLKPGGLLVLKSRTPAALSLPPLLIITRRVRVQAVYYAAFERALAYLERRAERLHDFIGSEWTLEEHERAFATAGAHEGEKIYFKPHG